MAEGEWNQIMTARYCPTVSVVLAVHNGEAYLNRAIGSLLAQTLADYELIVVDDGSSDHTWDTICTCAVGQERLVTIRNGKNIGLSASLNKGLRVARGRYVARQDADDTSLPERLESQVTYLARHTDVGLLGTAYDVIDSKGRRVATHGQPSSDTEIRWQMLFYNAFCHSSVMFRRELVTRSRIDYDEELPYAQDYDLWARLLRHTRGANLQSPLVSYRVHGGNRGMVNPNGQTQVVLDIATRQLADLEPKVPFSREDVDTLRRWYYAFPERVESNDVPLCRKLLQILSTFTKQECVDPTVASHIRQSWTKRIEAALPS